MKKIIINILIVLLIVLSLTACKQTNESSNKVDTKQIICTQSIKTDTDEELELGIIDYEDDIVKRLTQRTEYTLNDDGIEQTDIDRAIEILSDTAKVYDDIDGYKFKIEKMDENKFYTSLEIDYEKINIEQLKESLGEEYINNNYPNGNKITVNEIKKIYFNEFECEEQS